MTYKLLFIDEQKEAHREFFRKLIKPNEERFIGELRYPKGSLVEMIDEIFNDIKPDAILTDYSLNEHKSDAVNYHIEYNGKDLAEAVRDLRVNFPIFITTSFSNDAAQNGADALIVYDKSHFGDKLDSDNHNEKGLTLADRIFYSVSGYKKQLDDWSYEFDELFNKRSNKPLSEPEEARLIELDNHLESALDRKSKLPESLKQTSNAQKLEELIAQTKKILEQRN